MGNPFVSSFLREEEPLSPLVGALSMMTVKKSGLVILNPVTPANKKCLSSQRESAELIWAVTGGGTFSNADHLLALREERRDGHKTEMTSMTPNSRV